MPLISGIFSPQGPIRYIGVHMHTQKCVKRGIFCSRTRKAGNAFRGLKFHLSNSSDLNLFKGLNLRQNPTKSLFRG